MINDVDNICQEDIENTLEYKEDDVAFDMKEFTELIIYEIFGSDGEYANKETLIFQLRELEKDLFESIFIKLASLDKNIEESLNYLEIHGNQKDILKKEFKEILQKALGQAVVSARIENKIDNILTNSDKSLNKLDLFKEYLLGIFNNLRQIKSTVIELKNQSISYEYAKLTIYVTKRQKREEKETGHFFNKKKEISYNDAYFLVIEENGREVRAIERSSWDRDIDENEFFSILNRYYGANGWDLIKLPEQEGKTYNCLLKKQIIG